MVWSLCIAQSLHVVVQSGRIVRPCKMEHTSTTPSPQNSSLYAHAKTSFNLPTFGTDRSLIYMYIHIHSSIVLCISGYRRVIRF